MAIYNIPIGFKIFHLIAYSFCSNLDFRVGNDKFTRVAWVVNFTWRSVLKVILRVQLVHIADSFCSKFWTWKYQWHMSQDKCLVQSIWSLNCMGKLHLSFEIRVEVKTCAFYSSDSLMAYFGILHGGKSIR